MIDSPLTEFIPQPDVVERFERRIAAPPRLVMDVVKNFDLQSLRLVRMIFRMRELFMRSKPQAPRRPLGLVDEMKNLGWGSLIEEMGEGELNGKYTLAFGAVCQPWLADVKFTSIRAQEFAAFSEPNQVKIAWSLQALPDESAPTPVLRGETSSTVCATRFIHETRVVATDSQARERFKRYWRWARFGIVAIRLLLLPAIRRQSERKWRSQQMHG